MIIKIFLILLISISSTNAAEVRTTGDGDLATSLDATACSAYAVSIGATDSGEANWGTGKATGCSHWTGQNKVFFNTNAYGTVSCSNVNPCIDAPQGPPPDYYISPDPELTPTEDELWFTQDVACGVGNFVTLTGTDGDWSCKSCNGDGSSTGKELFLEEYTLIRETGTGFLHGKCCINGHHRVCQQLLEYYKENCDDTDKGHVSNRVCT